MRDIEEIREALRPLFARGDVRMVIAFGSVAEGRARADSDIDLAVLRDAPGVEDLVTPVMALLRTENIDLIDLRRAPPLLAMAIVRGGHVLYQDPESTFASFASLALRRYEDSAKLRRAREDGVRMFVERHQR